MTLERDSEEASAGTTNDYASDHPGEHPSDWGWHAQWGRGARVGGWVVVAILLVMTTATNYQLEYHLVLWLLAAGLALALIRDRIRRRNAWRNRN